MIFWLFYAICTGNSSLKSCQQHHKWYQCIPCVKTINKSCNMHLFGHVMPLASSFVSHDATGIDVNVM